MTIQTPQCPECGLPAKGTLETVFAIARLTDLEPDGVGEYEGTTEILWDTQTTVLAGQKSLLVCRNGHQWASEVHGERDQEKWESRIRMTTKEKLERALALLAETTTVVRDLYCGYPPRECGTHPVDCVTQNRVFFEAVGELGDEMRETWTIE